MTTFGLVLDRAVIVGILFCMVLHCAGRIGFLSHLYQYRHDIAFTLGLIEEKPIAMCSHEYDFARGLIGEGHETPDRASSPIIFHSHEIQLLPAGFVQIKINPERSAVTIGRKPALINWQYPTPVISIFHPPLLS